MEISNVVMECSIQLLIAIATVTFIFIMYGRTKRHPKCPPSLPWLPVVGSLPFLSGIDTLQICLTEKAKRYGNVYSFYAGSRYAVVLNGYEAIREALIKRSADFAGRITVYSVEHVWNPEARGLGFRQYDDHFKLLRNTTIAILRQLGMGERAVIETKIHEEVQECLKFIHDKKSVAFNPEPILRISVLNIIHSLLFGKRFDWDDPTGHYMSNIVIAFVTSLLPILDLFPIARFIPSIRRMLNDIRLKYPAWRTFFDSKIDECLKRHPSEQETFITEFVKQTGTSFDREELFYTVMDLVNAGTDTSTTQLCWALIMLSNYPSVQKSLQQEIDSVVRKDRLPSLSDKLPYLEATVLELMRLKIVVPLGIPHKTSCDTEVAGFFIPAETQVMINLCSAHMDPTVWKEPDVFRPERFLNEDGEVINRDRMICFSLGKRSCPGESLARQEVFLYVGALMQHFQVLPPDGNTSISENGKVGIVYAPDPFEVRFLPRTEKSTLA